MGGYDEVSTHAKTRYLVAILHAKRLAVATRYLVHGKYVVGGVGVVIYAFTSRVVKKKKPQGRCGSFSSKSILSNC